MPSWGEEPLTAAAQSLMPFELYYSDLESLSEDSLALLARLVGAKDAGLGAVRAEMARVNRMWSRRCIRLRRGVKECVLSYKASLRAVEYLRRPILAAARGAVVRHLAGGSVAQLAMPFAKFFNYRECRACSRRPERIVATVKLDGTLVVATRDPDTGELLLGTRGSLHRPPAAVNPYVERFLAAVEREGLRYELDTLVREDATTMFELVNTACPGSMCLGRELEAPPGDPRWRPWLLAVRSHSTMGLRYGLETGFPSAEPIEARSFAELLEQAAGREDGEGIVVYEPGATYLGLPWWNYMLKLKNRRYVLRATLAAAEVDEATRRAMYRRIARLAAAGRLDDLLPLLEGTPYLDFAHRYQRAYLRLAEAYQQLAEAARDAAKRLGREKLANLLRSNLSAASLAEALDVLLEDPEKLASTVVREKLLAKGGPKKLLDALERHRRRVEKLAQQLQAQR